MSIITALLLLLCGTADPPSIQWGGERSGVDRTHVELIDDAASLRKAWSLVHGGSMEGLPIVDFDRHRLVLACRGRAMNVRRVVGTGLETEGGSIRLTVDADPNPPEDGVGPEETTAWGLFVIPRNPTTVHVGYHEPPDDCDAPRWTTIVVLGSDRPDPRTEPDSGQEGPVDGSKPPRFVPDLSLLEPRRASDRDEDVDGSPHAALFHRDDRMLLFIGAVHQRDVANDPTHRMVRAAIEGFRPDAVIIEGVPTSAGPQPERMLESARRRVRTGKIGESGYAAVLADDRGAIVIGGEPDPQATTDLVREAGFTDDDLLGFLVARNLNARSRDGTDIDEDRVITRAIETLRRRFNVESTMDAKGFRDWYRSCTGGPFDARRIRAEVSPMLVDEPSTLRRISILSMLARERNLVRLEARLLEEHERVLVVYGSGHLRWERRLLERMLGEPVLVTSTLTVETFDDMNRHLDRLRGSWTVALDPAPDYFVSHGYDRRWSEAMIAGIDAARDYLGNYGPLQVYIIGQERDELAEPSHRDEIARYYCEVHDAGSGRPMSECLSGDGRDLVDKALTGATEAYLTMAMESDPPRAEIVFINPHQFGEEMPTRGIHEYVHVYQKAFAFTPTWMMEGGAELLACHLGEKRGWCRRTPTMEGYARSLERAEGLRYTIRDMEEIETTGPLVARWHRELAYDAGAWAVAYLIAHTPTRSIGDYFRDYFPLADRMGWRAALCDSTDFGSVDDFYAGFDRFLDRPLEERIALLESLAD